jgi:hypothetical protein
MRFSVFLVLCTPVLAVSGAACGSEPNKRPAGPAPVYEPWVLPSWQSQATGGAVDAVDALLDAEPTAPLGVEPAVASSTSQVASPQVSSPQASSPQVSSPQVSSPQAQSTFGGAHTAAMTSASDARSWSSTPSASSVNGSSVAH